VPRLTSCVEFAQESMLVNRVLAAFWQQFVRLQFFKRALITNFVTQLTIVASHRPALRITELKLTIH
jgi:hypothetical protein